MNLKMKQRNSNSMKPSNPKQEKVVKAWITIHTPNNKWFTRDKKPPKNEIEFDKQLNFITVPCTIHYSLPLCPSRNRGRLL